MSSEGDFITSLWKDWKNKFAEDEGMRRFKVISLEATCWVAIQQLAGIAVLYSPDALALV